MAIERTFSIIKPVFPECNQLKVFSYHRQALHGISRCFIKIWKQNTQC